MGEKVTGRSYASDLSTGDGPSAVRSLIMKSDCSSSFKDEEPTRPIRSYGSPFGCRIRPFAVILGGMQKRCVL